VKVYAALWLRGFAIVCCTAMNVVNISQHHWTMAGLTGGAISLIWRWNARNAVKADTLPADLAYALGAAMGTLTGMALAGLLKQ
jgi:hypothetical protein